MIDLSRYSSAGFDRGASRWKEAFWVVTKCCFFLSPFPFPSRLRCWLLRLFGASIGRGVIIRSQVNVWFPWRLVIGDSVWLGEGAFLLNLAQISIEANSCISQRAFLCTGSHDYRATEFTLIVKPIVIHTSSWIAAQAFVGPGVEIGPGSVVSAGSVTFRDVPPNTLAQGNPVQLLKAIDRSPLPQA